MGTSTVKISLPNLRLCILSNASAASLGSSYSTKANLGGQSRLRWVTLRSCIDVPWCRNVAADKSSIAVGELAIVRGREGAGSSRRTGRKAEGNGGGRRQAVCLQGKGVRPFEFVG